MHMSSTPGRATWPKGSTDNNDAWAVIDIMMHMGFFHFPQIADHWNIDELYDFSLIHAYVLLDFFCLLCGYFLHLARAKDGNQEANQQGREGKAERRGAHPLPELEKKMHHICYVMYNTSCISVSARSVVLRM